MHSTILPFLSTLLTLAASSPVPLPEDPSSSSTSGTISSSSDRVNLPFELRVPQIVTSINSTFNSTQPAGTPLLYNRIRAYNIPANVSNFALSGLVDVEMLAPFTFYPPSSSTPPSKPPASNNGTIYTGYTGHNGIPFVETTPGPRMADAAGYIPFSYPGDFAAAPPLETVATTLKSVGGVSDLGACVAGRTAKNPFPAQNATAAAVPSLLWSCQPQRQVDNYIVFEISSGRTGQFKGAELGVQSSI